MEPNQAIILDELWRPRIVQVDENLVLVAFPFMKVLTAWGLISIAEEDGLLQKGALVVESSSGNLALGLAIVCALRKQPLLIISDTNLDPAHRKRIEGLGARVETVTPFVGAGGSQGARLRRLDAELRKSEPGRVFAVYQYMREANKYAYGRLAALLAGRHPQIDCLVGTVGTGGSMCGTARYLRLAQPKLHTIGVDVHNSVLFGQQDGPRHIGGLGASLLPPGLEHSAFDEVHWLTAGHASVAGQDLHRATGLFQGPTSGLAWRVGRRYAEEHRDKMTAVLLPDEGHRYMGTLYDPDWLAARGIRPRTADEQPITIFDPRKSDGSSWSRMGWNRRSLAQVLNQDEQTQ